MRPKKALIFVLCLTFCLGGVCVVSAQKSPENRAVTKKDTTSVVLKKRDALAGVDSLLIIHFHPTVQCSCCINVGIFAKKGLEKYYAKPHKDGRILFRKCNIDEDSLTVKKYKIFSSALGFKKLIKGKEEFKEIESVWQFCEDEEKFLPNFKKELDEFINSWKKEEEKGKSKE